MGEEPFSSGISQILSSISFTRRENTLVRIIRRLSAEVGEGNSASHKLEGGTCEFFVSFRDLKLHDSSRSTRACKLTR